MLLLTVPILHKWQVEGETVWCVQDVLPLLRKGGPQPF